MEANTQQRRHLTGRTNASLQRDSVRVKCDGKCCQRSALSNITSPPFPGSFSPAMRFQIKMAASVSELLLGGSVKRGGGRAAAAFTGCPEHYSSALGPCLTLKYTIQQ